MSTLPDPNYNYFGIEFCNALWEDVCRCCIFPPDAAFAESDDECFDADGKPIPPPVGEDGDRIIILWRMDEPVDQRQRRPRLYAILAAFAHLYRQRVSRRDWLRLVVVRYTETPSSGSEMPPVNFRLWNTSFLFTGGSFMLEHEVGREYEQSLPPALPPCPVQVCAAAQAEWLALVEEHLEFLLASIRDASSYAMLKTALDEWFSYLYQRMGYAEAEPEAVAAGGEGLEERIERLRFMPWYPEALRRMPGLNEQGLCCIALPSAGRFALLDYRPEEGRRFRYESLKPDGEEGWPAEGRLHLAQAGEEALPYDAARHLHLLPVPCKGGYSYMRLEGVTSCWRYDERWLGTDYNWS